jgi:4-amino-4-deoxy-L-arabinose transferase-like glycosyltransferase
MVMGEADGSGAPDVAGLRDGEDPRRAALTRAERRWLLGIVVVAALLRIAWLAFANVDPPTALGDTYSYWYHGNSIADGRGYVSYVDGRATAYYPIGFPAILGGLYWLAGHVPAADPDLMLVTGGFQVVVSVATVALTFVIGRRLAGARAGLVAAGIMALFPNLIHELTAIQVETTFIFLAVAALAIIVDHDWSSGPPGRNRLLAFGAVLAVSALVRPFSLPLLLGLFLALLAVGLGWRRSLVLTSVPLLVLVAAFTPWTIRNAIALDAFVPSSTNMGDTLCIDRNSEATGSFRWTVHDGCVDINLPEVARNRGNTRKAIEWVVHNPERELVQIGRRARHMFAHDHDGIQTTETMGSGPVLSDTGRRIGNATADWYFRGVLVLAVVGLPLLHRRSPRPERRIVFTTFGALLAIPLLLWGHPRFHQPLVPLMALSAGVLAVALAERVSARRTARDAAAGPAVEASEAAASESGRTTGTGAAETGAAETAAADSGAALTGTTREVGGATGSAEGVAAGH